MLRECCTLSNHSPVQLHKERYADYKFSSINVHCLENIDNRVMGTVVTTTV